MWQYVRIQWFVIGLLIQAQRDLPSKRLNFFYLRLLLFYHPIEIMWRLRLREVNIPLTQNDPYFCSDFIESQFDDEQSFICQLQFIDQSLDVCQKSSGRNLFFRFNCATPGGKKWRVNVRWKLGNCVRIKYARGGQMKRNFDLIYDPGGLP